MRFNLILRIWLIRCSSRSAGQGSAGNDEKSHGLAHLYRRERHPVLLLGQQFFHIGD